ncbi:MAG: hypothetical protein AB8G15_01400 [Saprospiraceae bacterium]
MFWRDDREDQERLIMDLDLVVGDSFDLQAIPNLSSYYYCDDQRYAIVVSVDEIEDRKRINFDCSGTFDPLQFIEGVGPNASILLGTPDPWLWNFFDFTICQKYENDILTFTYNNDFENGCLPQTISTDEVATPQYFQVSPNPAKDFLSFKWKNTSTLDQIATFKIQDATGKIVLH